MSRKIILFFLFVVIFHPSYFVFANLQINEIMYDLKTGSDDGREWIEIYNGYDVSVNLSSYRLFEADTNHKIKLVEGDTDIPAKGYAIIISSPIKFKTDWPNLGGIIFDSSFSLNNDGEVLMLKDKDLNIVDQYTYKSNLGGAGDGKSLQKINQGGNMIWQGATPTPGQENKIAFISPPSQKITVAVKSLSIPKKVSTEEDPQENQKKILSSDSHSNLDMVNESNLAYVAESTSFNFPALALPFLLAGSAGAVYFIRRKKIIPKGGDDFKILDE